ncbi:MAG: hypothetical protein ACXWJF_13050 [Burkholderiaceae bacterium]
MTVVSAPAELTADWTAEKLQFAAVVEGTLLLVEEELPDVLPLDELPDELPTEVERLDDEADTLSVVVAFGSVPLEPPPPQAAINKGNPNWMTVRVLIFQDEYLFINSSFAQ